MTTCKFFSISSVRDFVRSEVGEEEREKREKREARGIGGGYEC
jgi:hypothetical protein